MKQSPILADGNAPDARFTLASATKLLNRAGLRLETNGIGYQIAHGRQMLAGCGRRNYEMSLNQVIAFTREALVR